MSTLFAGRACQDPADFYRACTDAEPPLNTSWWGTVNLFRNPAGRGPGAGAILLTKADLDLINFTADNTLSFLDDRRTSNQIELKRITITRFYCLSSGWADDPRAVYLCRLVDRRHFLAQVPIDRAYNVRDADGEEYLPATTTDDGDPWTWADVVADIWGELDEGDAPALPFAPDGAPENLRFHGATAWESLHSVLDRLACTTVLDHTTDTFTIVRLGDAAGAAAVALAAALADMDGDELRTWDAYHGEPDRGRLPEKVRVLFPRRPVPTDGSSPYFAEDVTLAATAGVAAGTYVQLFDDLTAIGSGTPTNAAALTTRAVERAGDWRRKRLGYERRLTLEYRDFRHELKPGETAELTTLRDNGRPMVTLVESGPDGRMEDWRPFVPPLGADLSPAPEAGSCGFHVRKVDCVSFASTTGGSSVAVWDADAVGWVLPAPITTGDGPAVATLVEDDFNRYAVKLVSENATWHLNPTGRCDRTGAAVFRDSYLPLSLQEEPGEGSGSGSGSGVVPCAGETITLALKCVPCSLSCGEFGPFPASMCVVTAPTTVSPDSTPDPVAVCSFYFNATFSPVTVVYGASTTLAGSFVTYPVPSGVSRLSWVGKGQMTNPYTTANLPSGTLDYAVEIWFDDDCGPQITYYLPYVVFVGLGGFQLTYREFTLPFGTPSDFLELPPVGSFPITVPAGSVLPATSSQDNSGAMANPCPDGVTFPSDYPTVNRWSHTTAGTFSLGPITVYSGGCDDTDGGEGGEPADLPSCQESGESLADHPTLQATITDGSLAGIYMVPWVPTGATGGPSGSPIYELDTTIGAVPYQINLFHSGGKWWLWVRNLNTGALIVVIATAGACEPFGLVFPGTTLGSTVDVTVVIA